MAPFYAQSRFHLGELYSREGQKEKALDILKTAEDIFNEMGMDYWLTKAKEEKRFSLS